MLSKKFQMIVKHKDLTKQIELNLDDIKNNYIESIFDNSKSKTISTIDKLKLKALSAFNLINQDEDQPLDGNVYLKNFDLLYDNMPVGLNTLYKILNKFSSIKDLNKKIEKLKNFDNTNIDPDCLIENESNSDFSQNFLFELKERSENKQVNSGKEENNFSIESEKEKGFLSNSKKDSIVSMIDVDDNKNNNTNKVIQINEVNQVSQVNQIQNKSIFTNIPIQDLKKYKKILKLSIPKEEENSSQNLFLNFTTSYLIFSDPSKVKKKYLEFNENTKSDEVLSIIITNKSSTDAISLPIEFYINSCKIDYKPYANCENIKIIYDKADKDKEKTIINVRPNETFLLQMIIPSCIVEHIYKLEIRTDYRYIKPETSGKVYECIGLMENKVSYIKNNVSSLLLNYKNIVFSIVNEVSSMLQISFDIVYFLYLLSVLILLIIISASVLTDMIITLSSNEYFIIGQMIWTGLALILTMFKNIGTRFFGVVIFLLTISYLIQSFLFNFSKTYSSIIIYYSASEFLKLLWVMSFYVLQVFISYFAFQKMVM